MIAVADGVWQIPLMPRSAVNAYLLGDVLVDAGYAFQGPRVVTALAGREVAAHALTHAHVDHAGGSRHVHEALGVPVWVGAARVAHTPPVAPARVLQEGDEVGAGFIVLDTPGHSPGHVSFWRASDRVLVCGDVFFNLSIATLRYGLRPPPDIFTFDIGRNRESQRRLAELDPAVACFGHGPPLRDPARMRAVAGL